MTRVPARSGAESTRLGRAAGRLNLRAQSAARAGSAARKGPRPAFFRALRQLFRSVVGLDRPPALPENPASPRSRWPSGWLAAAGTPAKTARAGRVVVPPRLDSTHAEAGRAPLARADLTRVCKTPLEPPMCEAGARPRLNNSSRPLTAWQQHTCLSTASWAPRKPS